MIFLMWQDDTPKRSLADKIAAACAAYERRFGIAPGVAWVNPADVPETFVAGALPVRLVQTVQKNMIWVGQQEAK